MSRSFLPLISAVLLLLLVACTGASSSGGGETCGSGGGPASLGSMTFEMVDPMGFACEGDGTFWLQISAVSGGTTAPIANGEPAEPVDCCTCLALPYAEGMFCPQVPATGVTTSWDGTYWEPGKCGPSKRACYFHVSAPAGKYVANMCDFTFDASDGFVPASCVAVPFEYPGASPVVGTVM